MDEQKFSENCISCAQTPILRFSTIVGVPCLSVKCLHENSTKVDNISVSKLCFCTATLTVAFLLTAAVYYAFWIKAWFVEKNNVLILITFLINLIFCLRSGLIITVLLLKANVSKAVYQEIQSVIKGWQLLRNETLFDREAVLRIRTQTTVRTAGLCFLSISVAIYLLMTEFKNDLTFIPHCSSCISLYMDLAITVLLQSIVELYLSIFKRYEEILKSHLSDILVKTKIGTKEEAVILTMRLHDTLMWSFRGISDLCGSLVVIWVILATTILVGSCFVILVVLFDDSLTFSNRFILAMLQFLVTSIAILKTIDSLDKLEKMSQDILSFLYKYPISKLNKVEADQVEMLIRTLIVHKPVLRASDIFTLGTRLLASISGTVVTYVLVAVQFYVSWLKRK